MQPKLDNAIFLCAADDVTEGQPHRVDIKPHPPFAVYKVAGVLYVTDDTCSHGQASLGDEGEQDGFTIICTWHDGAFDIRTGAFLSVPCNKAIRSYPVTLRDGGVHIDISGCSQAF